MRAAIAAAALFLALAEAAAAKPPSVRIFAERSFGYFVGDLVDARVEIVADSSLRLQTASLPRPGALRYWLDLRETRVESHPAGEGETRWSIALSYQLFYVALDVRELEIPAFSLRFTREGANDVVATSDAPAWKIGVSPLREVLPQRRENPIDYMQPDSVAARVDAGPPRARAGGLLAAALALLTLVARDRGWPPFHARRARVFAAAARRIAALARRDDRAAWREGAQALHRALDATAGRRIFADDLDAFLSRHGEFGAQREALQRFFSASRAAFFDVAGREKEEFAWPRLVALAKALARHERSAR